MDWQPIETAPKDGTRVLMRFQHVNYQYATPSERGDWEEICIAYWTDHNSGGWVWHGICGAPTHWMPLPPPPADRSEP